MARPPAGAALTDKCSGSKLAKARAQTIIKTMRGEVSIAEAAEVLGICQSAFHKLRDTRLQAFVEACEPRPAGRPPEARPDAPERVQELQASVVRLEHDLAASEARCLLAQQRLELVEKKRLSQPRESGHLVRPGRMRAVRGRLPSTRSRRASQAP